MKLRTLNIALFSLLLLSCEKTVVADNEAASKHGTRGLWKASKYWTNHNTFQNLYPGVQFDFETGGKLNSQVNDLKKTIGVWQGSTTAGNLHIEVGNEYHDLNGSWNVGSSDGMKMVLGRVGSPDSLAFYK
jgi:hypothetical protein